MEAHRNGITGTILEDTLDDALLNFTYDRILEDNVHEALSELFPALHARRLRSNDDDWAQFVERCLAHPVRELLHQDPFSARAFLKPRGYAGDAVTLDYIYGREEGWPAPEGTSPLGRQIFDFTTGASAAEAVRARRGFVADVVDRLVDEVTRPHILSIASGHLREALLSGAVKRRRIGRYVALDSDSDALAEVHRCYAPFGVEIVPGRIRNLLNNELDLGDFDLVYATGVFDYLALAAAQRLTWTMFQMLRPRGRLLVANFMPGILDVGYMESFMAWKLVYRTRQEMMQISEHIAQSEIRDIRLRAEESQNIIFLQVTKR